MSSVGVAVIGSVGGVIAMRGLQGAFGALLMPNTIALIRAAFPLEELNRAVGIWSASSAAAIAGAPVIGGLLVEKVSWQSVFFLNVPIGIATIICGLIVVPESRESTRHKFDLPGLALLASSMFCLVFAVIHSETWGWTSSGVLGLLGASAVLAAAFVLVERRVTAPLVPIPLLATRSIALRDRDAPTQLLRTLRSPLLRQPLPAERAGPRRGRGGRAAPAAHRGPSRPHRRSPAESPHATGRACPSPPGSASPRRLCSECSI